MIAQFLCVFDLLHESLIGLGKSVTQKITFPSLVRVYRTKSVRKKHQKFNKGMNVIFRVVTASTIRATYIYFDTHFKY